MEVNFGQFTLKKSGSYGTPELHMNGARYGACDIPAWPADMVAGIPQREQWSAAYAVRVTPPLSPLTAEEHALAMAFLQLAQQAQGAPTLDHLR